MDGDPDEGPDGVESGPGGQDVFPVPGFAAGGRVEHRDRAGARGRVHRPAGRREAVISPESESGVIHYYFPVQVEVVGTLPDTEVQRVAGYVFDQLDRELATRI